MTVYSVIKALIMPPGGIILTLGASWFLVHGRLGRLILITGTSLLTLMSLPVVSTSLIEPLESYPALDLRVPLPADARAILVLSAGLHKGAAEYQGDTLDEFSLQRVRYGAYLHRATGLPIYVSGGKPSKDTPAVAAVMAQVLRDEFQVPVAGVEDHSGTSWENAAYSKPMLEKDGISRILLVSSAWHLPRAAEACERAGIAVIPAPTGFISRPGWGEDLGLSDWLPSAKAFNTSYYALHEHLGRIWYEIRLWVQGAPRATSAKG